MFWSDTSVLEAASWRLASELVRRHPKITRLIRAHPGGGQYDVLTILGRSGASDGDIKLNRAGTIQIHNRFDGRPGDGWGLVTWDEYLRADPKEFLRALEAAAGLPAPSKVPSATPTTLTYRILAAIASTGVKAVETIDIQPGYIDTSGYGGGRNDSLDAFPSIPAELHRATQDDLFGEAGYRFWVVHRGGAPVLALEQGIGLAWTTHHGNPYPLMPLYEECRRHLLVTTLKLLRRVDNV